MHYLLGRRDCKLGQRLDASPRRIKNKYWEETYPKSKILTLSWNIRSFKLLPILKGPSLLLLPKKEKKKNHRHPSTKSFPWAFNSTLDKCSCVLFYLQFKGLWKPRSWPPGIISWPCGWWVSHEVRAAVTETVSDVFINQIEFLAHSELG